MADPASPPSSDSLSLPGASPLPMSPAQTVQGTPPPGSPQDTFGPNTPNVPAGAHHSSPSTAGPGPSTVAAAAAAAATVSSSTSRPGGGGGSGPQQLAGLAGLARLAGFSRDSPPGSPIESEGPESSLGHSLGHTSGWAASERSYDERSGRSSWRFESAGSAAAQFSVARKQRISANPPLPDKPYKPPPVPPLSPNTIAAAQALQPPAPSFSSSPWGSPGSASSLGRKKAAQAREIERSLAFDEQDDDDEHRSLSLASASTRGTGSTDLPPLPSKDIPRYPFLAQDPALIRSDSPSSLRGAGAAAAAAAAAAAGGSTYTSLPVRRHSGASAAASEPANPSRPKHLSVQSTYSESYALGGGLDTPDSSGRRGWNVFAGGPPPAWGRRDSQRSVKSAKSGRSSKSLRRRRSKHASLAWAANEGDEWVNEDDADLLVLVRRAAVLERLLRAGKRASGATGNKRFSTFSTSTRYGGSNMSRHGTSATSRAGGGGAGGVGVPHGSQSPPPPSSSTSHNRRSAQSTGPNSIRARLARRFARNRERPFAGLGSEASGDSPPHRHGDLDDSGDEDEGGGGGGRVDLGSEQYHESLTSHASRAPTPPRRAVSTSLTRDQREPTPPGVGTGVIVFPELAALPPLEPVNRNGDLCAQSCLSPSQAIPYNPLPPPPPASHGTGLSSRSLHSLRNLRWLDEKHPSAFFSSSPSVQPRESRNLSVLWGDVPYCDEHIRPKSARKCKFIVAFACIVGIILIVGLLAGLLARRRSQLTSS